MKAMIFAAGLGTRLRPITNNIPKALVPYKGKPLLQHVIEKLKFYGFDQIVINVHYFADQIIDFLTQNNNFGLTIHISDETGELLETGGGLYKARKFLDGHEPFLLHNVDIISDLNLLEFYNAMPGDAIAMLATQKRDAGRILLFSQAENFLCGWQNKKTGETITARNNCPSPVEMSFSGIHVVSPRIFDYLWEGKYSITKAYLQIAAKERIAYYDHTGGEWKDMGKPSAFVN